MLFLTNRRLPIVHLEMLLQSIQKQTDRRCLRVGQILSSTTPASMTWYPIIVPSKNYRKSNKAWSKTTLNDSQTIQLSLLLHRKPNATILTWIFQRSQTQLKTSRWFLRLSIQKIRTIPLTKNNHSMPTQSLLRVKWNKSATNSSRFITWLGLSS